MPWAFTPDGYLLVGPIFIQSVIGPIPDEQKQVNADQQDNKEIKNSKSTFNRYSWQSIGF